MGLRANEAAGALLAAGASGCPRPARAGKVAAMTTCAPMMFLAAAIAAAPLGARAADPPSNAAAPPAAAPARPPPAKPLPGAPHWLSLPTRAQMDTAYPTAGARAGGVTGTATLDCRIGADGRMADCMIADEAPRGRGFGEAALKLVPDFQMTTERAGKSLVGHMMIIPFVFTPPTFLEYAPNSGAS